MTKMTRSNYLKIVLQLVFIILCVEGNLSGSDISVGGSVTDRINDFGSIDGYSQEEENQNLIESSIKTCDELKSENNIDDYNSQDCGHIIESENILLPYSLGSESNVSDIPELPISLSINDTSQSNSQVLMISTEKNIKSVIPTSLLNQKTKAKIRVCLNQRNKDDVSMSSNIYTDYNGNNNNGNDHDDQLILKDSLVDCTDEDSLFLELNYESQPVFPSVSTSFLDKVR